MFHARQVAAHSPFAVVYLYRPGDGGLDRVAIQLANHLHRRGLRVELWLAHLDGPLAGMIDPALTVRRVCAPRWARRLSMIAQFLPLAAMVRRHRPDVVYSAGNQSNMLVAAATLGTQTRAVGRISNPIVRPGQQGLSAWARKTRFRAIARACSMTIVMGETDRQLLAEEGPLGGRDVRLMPRPTVTRLMEQACNDRGTACCPQRPAQLLMVGRLAPQKDQATALAALAQLRGRDWRLRIVGQGPLRAQLEAQCARLGLSDRVEFLGFVDCPHRMASLFAEADLLLQPSCWEGLAGTMIEALGCGAGVVATDCTRNIHPLLAAAGQHPPVPVGHVDGFARAIEWALGHPAPPEQLAQAVREHGLDRALDTYMRALMTVGARELPVGVALQAFP
ncbi:MULTISPECIES: glycosyltransferase [Sphingobium]|uniref:Glycosyltransferase n=1 Tax=Sphingobium yanoikuyae TaxID=13690 RepID=A0A9X7YDB4_SPHYA|nr:MULTISPECIES: glycosyltransferase [Sphingobium]PZU67545.1 MAG: glycosyltransferase [Sphingobium sp.]QNG46796.1 glycosyltransferase [Sphingobium yanoikuyae]